MDVLVPVDGSDPADSAIDHAVTHFPEANITVLYVMDPVDGATAWGPVTGEDWVSAAEERAESVLAEASERAADAGHDVETASVIGRPSQAIVEYAEEHDVDQVVIGSHGRKGVARVLLGSVAETVVRRTPSPVTVVRTPET
ncbi:MAG: universal stress protein [Natronomonas sp.]